MKKEICYTLLADGSSDKTLIPLINLVLNQVPDLTYRAQFAEHTLKPSAGLRKRAEKAIDIYACDLLLIHRDAENMPFDHRLTEIAQELASLGMPYLPVIPVRMTEAWLLVDEQAIRSAAGNPNGKIDLQIPAAHTLEKLLDPKKTLFDTLRIASELPPRRQAKFQPESSRHRVAQLIDDLDALRQLPAFANFERELLQYVEAA